MDYPILRRSILFEAHFAFGCTTVVTPVPSSEVATADYSSALSFDLRRQISAG